MKLDHVSLPVADVRATRAFFEKYFGFRCTVETDADKFVGLTGSGGLLLTISNLDGVSEVVCPKSFHVGFRRDSDDRETAEIADSFTPILYELRRSVAAAGV